MRIKNESLLEEMTASNERVSKVSYSVDDFVELMRHLERVKESIEVIQERYEFSKMLYDLCNEFKVELSEEDSTTMFMVTETNKALHASIQFSEDSVKKTLENLQKSWKSIFQSSSRRSATSESRWAT